MLSSRSSTPDFPNGHDTTNTSTTSSPPPDSNIDHAHSIAYWSDVPATVDGMLGGFPQVSRIDLQGSKSFLTRTKRLLSIPSDKNLKLPRGVDCGAGIGRVTDGFLCEVCDVVDAVEPVEKFSRVLRKDRGGEGAVKGEVYTTGLESWCPEHDYDLVWVQWCAGHLTDEQLLKFIERCRRSLSTNGVMIVKENTTTEVQEGDVYDEEDSSVTRSHEKFLELFEEANMRVVSTELQLGFPRRLGLLPVRFYALRPVD
ncbi:uncharacterized protein KD926_000631 [Aspergillus affinis]|uniref:uncharacterized protein n=1 Tax=Aspergillus affinis TaxID=1070780 RepID=UPI0022FEE947|nr:uncharacterized protein KD926_000631 [Aspergillus affinis]KAI9037344.1 hypothetical protein KD926_000631 [Aspergillus affinis]